MTETPTSKKLLLASPRGFCAGVRRAIATLNETIKDFSGETIYCYHQIVHNTHVVKSFEDKGIKFVDSLEEVPDGSLLVFSSHGVSPAIREKAETKNLRTIDATCPFVNRTHLEVKKYTSEGLQIIYIGEPGHDETIGTTGEAPNNTHLIHNLEDIDHLSFSPTTALALITQTTLSLDETEHLKQALRKKFPQLIEPRVIDICQATQNRQAGVKELVKKDAQVIIVLGSANSSNSNKLKKVAEEAGIQAFLVDEITDLKPDILQKFDCLGLTGGASLPEEKITEAIEWLKKLGYSTINEVGIS